MAQLIESHQANRSLEKFISQLAIAHFYIRIRTRHLTNLFGYINFASSITNKGFPYLVFHPIAGCLPVIAETISFLIALLSKMIWLKFCTGVKRGSNCYRIVSIENELQQRPNFQTRILLLVCCLHLFRVIPTSKYKLYNPETGFSSCL